MARLVAGGERRGGGRRSACRTRPVALGARYRYRPQWVLSAGVAYDSVRVDDDDRTIDLPPDRQIRVGLGADSALRSQLQFPSSK